MEFQNIISIYIKHRIKLFHYFIIVTDVGATSSFFFPSIYLLSGWIYSWKLFWDDISETFYYKPKIRLRCFDNISYKLHTSSRIALWTFLKYFVKSNNFLRYANFYHYPSQAYSSISSSYPCLPKAIIFQMNWTNFINNL